MDRRQFLKIGTLSTGAVMAGGLPAGAKTGTVKKYSSALETKGYVKEPARRIPVVDKADVVVVGGGPAGFAAAIAAARQGSDVLVLERQYFLGGLFTGCGVTPIINMYNPVRGGSPVKAVSGICEELCDRLDKVGMLNYEKVRPKVDPEAAKYYMEEMLSVKKGYWFHEEGHRLFIFDQETGMLYMRRATYLTDHKWRDHYGCRRGKERACGHQG